VLIKQNIGKYPQIEVAPTILNFCSPHAMNFMCSKEEKGYFNPAEDISIAGVIEIVQSHVQESMKF